MGKNIAALYIRVSTDAQFEEGYSVEAQKELLTAYCKSRQIKNFSYYIDGGFTGSNINRPEMQRLISDCKVNKISYVIVYKLDRLSRSQKDTLYLIEDVFLPHNVDFISINESFDTSTPFGRAMIGILSVFAQLERENIKMRTRMGMQERVKSGLWMGGGRVPYGYDYNPELGILVPNADALNVKKMYNLFLDGYSCDRIAKIFGLKYDRLVYQILTRKTNTGTICYNGEEYQGQHEPIISIEIYNQTIQEFERRSQIKSYSSSQHLLTGLLYCGKCGAKMRYQKWGDSVSKIYCYSQQKSKKYLIKDPDCDNAKNWADDVDNAVIQDFFRVIKYKTNNKDGQSENNTNIIKVLRERYDSVSNKIKNLYNLYATDPNEILKSTISDNQKKLKDIMKQIELETNKQSIIFDKNNLQKKIENIADGWEFMNIKEKRDVLKSCIEKVIITDNNIDVIYRI